jgi:hypothetical protein
MLLSCFLLFASLNMFCFYSFSLLYALSFLLFSSFPLPFLFLLIFLLSSKVQKLMPRQQNCI